MKNTSRFLMMMAALVAIQILPPAKVMAQEKNAPVMSTPPASLEELQAMYNSTVQERSLKIMQALAMNDEDKSNRVFSAIVAQYHALRARDESIDDALWNVAKGSHEWSQQRDEMFPMMSKPLHDHFIAAISPDLTPDQLETVKDKMTYGKVQFTYNAYCSIIPNLTEEDKKNILDWLKQAREVAMDGGTSGEKTAIFQQYKQKINGYLKSEGIDVAEATEKWVQRQQPKQGDSTSTEASAVAH